LGAGIGRRSADPGATSGESVVEQLVRDIDRGPALRGRYLLDQRGQPCGEVARKIHKTLSATDRRYSSDHLSYCGVADRRDLVIWLHGHATPKARTERYIA
jgi:hypothetical protein